MLRSQKNILMFNVIDHMNCNVNNPVYTISRTHILVNCTQFYACGFWTERRQRNCIDMGAEERSGDKHDKESKSNFTPMLLAA